MWTARALWRKVFTVVGKWEDGYLVFGLCFFGKTLQSFHRQALVLGLLGGGLFGVALRVAKL